MRLRGGAVTSIAHGVRQKVSCKIVRMYSELLVDGSTSCTGQNGASRENILGKLSTKGAQCIAIPDTFLVD